MSEYSEIRVDVDSGVATITLHRPDRLNAFTATMARELVAAFDATDADDAIRVVILTGAGRGFCAGADLGRGERSFDADDESRAAERGDFGTVGGAPRDGGGVVSLRMASSLKPVIVAVNGPAVGIGATMTLPADIRIAAASARFGFVFARRGLVPEAASSWFLPRVVGISQAMEWVATGRVFDAEEARSGGLVSRVVPDDELIGTARGLAEEIARNTSAVSVTLSRRLLWSMLGASSPWEAHRLDSAAIRDLGRGADAREGVTSFLEKRPPRFPGRVDEHLGIVPGWPERPEEMT
ncbi:MULTISPECIES: enoyl-CoA hydratase-related protein [Pseudonocardia]|uniref:1,2-epoxyphenylacetyl-CoA isomerase n=2 Tax=Pseudonocardia TaxID=1847 RepID=A0A1Y2N7A0_PSEAH|nr:MULTISPECIES: enoyl-CoA hydratase-related protein [Pseudonocardia]OSY43344.1 1,2-epoxyphenylacetyl-CoA isomerase [Pseudonocardia autotrophica]TDN71831.1 enoyl-CoA hydratase/carnithine racemase [Pseudonocardia autotrophica]BBG02519.1 enoyl-CoA hydratase [Pseudonocardia autotrophica]GEC26900.1 enoyl-CoA hydratase [Pseudonocardia saturnea]